MLSKKKLKSTSFFKPYTPEGNYNLKQTGAGCYIIKKDGKVIYVGLSRIDVKKTMYRHFQQWNDNRTTWAKLHFTNGYERTTYVNEDRAKFSVKIIFTPDGREAGILEQLLIKKLKPRDNQLKILLFTENQFNLMDNKINDATAFNYDSDYTPF